MRSQSDRQRKRNRLLSEVKRAKVRDQIERFGFAMCEECGGSRRVEEREAMETLHGHHRKHRGMGASYNRPGIDDPENILLLCNGCHRRAHG